MCVVAENAAQEHASGRQEILDVVFLQYLNHNPAEEVMPVIPGDGAGALEVVSDVNECVISRVVQDELEHVRGSPHNGLGLHRRAEVGSRCTHREVEEVGHFLGLLNGAERPVRHPCDRMDSAVVEVLADAPEEVTLDEKDLLLGRSGHGDRT